MNTALQPDSIRDENFCLGLDLKRKRNPSCFSSVSVILSHCRVLRDCPGRHMKGSERKLEEQGDLFPLPEDSTPKAIQRFKGSRRKGHVTRGSRSLSQWSWQLLEKTWLELSTWSQTHPAQLSPWCRLPSSSCGPVVLASVWALAEPHLDARNFCFLWAA